MKLQYSSHAIAIILAVACTNMAQAALLQHDIFRGKVPVADQSFTAIGPASHSLVPELNGETLLIDTRADDTIVSGIFGPTPDLAAQPKGSYLFTPIPLISESHANAHSAGLSIILIGADASKAIHLNIWESSIWYYDETFAASEVLLPFSSASSQISLVLSENTVRVSNGVDLVDPTFPLFDYRANAGTQHPAIAPVYSMPNTIFIGDTSSTAAGAFLPLQIALFTNTTPVPLPASIWFFASALSVGLRKLCSSKT